MQSEITLVRRQGLLYATDVDGYETALPEGGSGNDAPPPSDEGGEGTATNDGGGVQPEEGQESTSQESTGQQTQPSGQGFIEPYLEDVDENIRPTVQQKLEQFRQDQDAQVTKRFDQLRQETEIPVTVYNALMDDPVGTLQWITERFQEDRGIDVRSQLLQQWQDYQEQQGEGGENEPDPNAPLTQADIDRILEEREQAKQQEAQQQQAEAQRAEQQTRTVHGWMDEAAKTHGLQFDDKDGQPDPLRTAIALQANQLHNSGQARGKAAVEMVVEQMAQRFGSAGNGNNEGGQERQPRTANGGSAPPAPDIDVTDNKQRKDRMFELFTGGQ